MARSWILGWSAGTLLLASLGGGLVALAGWFLAMTGRPSRSWHLLVFSVLLPLRIALSVIALLMLAKRDVRRVFTPWRLSDGLIAAAGLVAGVWPWFG